jgi:hypothetical protein
MRELVGLYTPRKIHNQIDLEHATEVADWTPKKILLRSTMSAMAPAGKVNRLPSAGSLP